jgi:transcriptional regulator with XRE-family HTH domain
MMNLDTYLRTANKTQEAFADEIGVRQATISRLKRGKRPSLDLAARIERATGGAIPASSWITEHREAS